MPHPANTLNSLPHSGIREIVDLALGLKRPVIRLEIGEPDFGTPEHIVQAARNAAGHSAYVQAAGIPKLRNALADSLARRYRNDVPASRVLVSHGAVHAIDSVLRAVISPGDKVLIPDPAWPNYEMQARLLGAKVVHYNLNPQNGYLPDVTEVATHLAGARVLILNSPSNPTGAVLPRELIEQLVHLAAWRDVLVISDEVYDEIIFAGEAVSAATLAPEHAVSVYSFSKSYAMTGWRVGYALVPEWLSDPLTRVLESAISCLSSVNQAAALEAITGDQGGISLMRAAYRKRRDLAVQMLSDAGIPVFPPGGAFYLMIPLAKGVDSRAVALELVRRGVATAPGSAFGNVASDALRISLANSEQKITEGLGIVLDWYLETGGMLR